MIGTLLDICGDSLKLAYIDCYRKPLLDHNGRFSLNLVTVSKPATARFTAAQIFNNLVSDTLCLTLNTAAVTPQ